MKKRKQLVISLVLVFAMLFQITGAVFASNAAKLPEEITAIIETLESSEEPEGAEIETLEGSEGLEGAEAVSTDEKATEMDVATADVGDTEAELSKTEATADVGEGSEGLATEVDAEAKDNDTEAKADEMSEVTDEAELGEAPETTDDVEEGEAPSDEPEGDELMPEEAEADEAEAEAGKTPETTIDEDEVLELDDELGDEYIGPGTWSSEDPYFTEDVPPEIEFNDPFAFFPSPFALFGLAPASEVPYPTSAEVYEQIMSLKDEYPEGLTWTNYEPYGSKGPLGEHYVFQGGPIKGARLCVGCAALVAIFQDEVYGYLPIRVIDDPEREDFHVGDIVRVNSNHFVLITQITAGGVIVVEGNYNKSVHWGRAISWDNLIISANFLVTRYPSWYTEEGNPDAEIANGSAGSLKWSLTQGGVLTISGKGAMPDFASERPSWESSGKPILSVEIEPGVTSVSNSAFFNQKDLVSVSLPDTVAAIGTNAFNGTNLVGVAIPGSCKTVGNNAFAYCPSLTSVDIGNGVETIGERAFRACTSLQYIDLPGSLKSVGAGAFFDCQYLRQARFMPNKNNIKIGADLFYNCWYLNFVSLPEGITEIPPGLFGSCKTVQYLYIPKTVTSIAEAGKTDPFMSSGGVGVIYFGGTQAQWNSLTKAIPMSLYSTVQALSFATVVVDQKDPFVPDENPVDDMIGCKDGRHLGPIDEDGVCENCGEDTDGSGSGSGSGEPSEPDIPVVPPAEHEHQWSDDWSHDDSHHWHECLVGGYFGCENGQKDGYASHEFGSWEVYIAATTEQAGISRRICDVCGHYETQEIPRLPDGTTEDGHSWSAIWSYDDNAHWRECENYNCGGVTNAENSYGVHEYGEWVVYRAATATHAGEKYRDCEICGFRETEEIPKLAEPSESPVPHLHNWSRDWSCDADGHWRECLTADCPITEDLQKSEYDEHTLSELIIDTPAAATEAGSGHKDCTVCGYSVTVVVPATGEAEEPGSSGSEEPSEPEGPGGSEEPGSGGAGSDEPSGPSNPSRPDEPSTPGGSSESGSSSSGSNGSGGTLTPNTSSTSASSTSTPDNSVTTRNPDGSITTVTTDKTGQTATTVQLPAAVVATAEQRGGSVTLPMAATRVAKDVATAMPITVQFDKSGTVKVEIPVVAPSAGTVAMLVNPDGSTSVIKTSAPTANGVTVPVENGATVKIVDNSKDFTDVTADAWYSDAAAFVSAHELFAGTSATEFSPELPMTRSMLMVVLARFDGAETAGGATWYDRATAWAIAKGVSDGSRPNDNITREQLVTMLWRYMGSPVVDEVLPNYADADQIGNYARDAMNWAVKNGLVNGFGDGRLGPQGQATRAQVAEIMRNLILLNSMQ